MSVSAKGIEITNRFFQAIDIMKAQGKIKSLRAITERYGLNYGNFYSIRKNPETFILKPELIARLIEDYNVSSDWILLGKGQPFKPLKTKKKNAIKMQ